MIDEIGPIFTGRYTNRVVLVTGAAQGLGAAMALRFAREGATVLGCDVRLSDEATAWATRNNIALSPVDVRSTSAVNAWVDTAVDDHGGVDVLVANAGIIDDGRVENISDDAWERVVDVSLGGTFRCIRAVMPHMKAARYGRVLAFSSMSWRGNFGQANYSAAKAGIVGLVRVVALEGAPSNISANAIAPGLIDTPMLASMDANGRAKLIARVPARRIGDPSDIAESAAFLCSEAAGYVTGVVLDVDGGISIGSALR